MTFLPSHLPPARISRACQTTFMLNQAFIVPCMLSRVPGFAGRGPEFWLFLAGLLPLTCGGSPSGTSASQGSGQTRPPGGHTEQPHTKTVHTSLHWRREALVRWLRSWRFFAPPRSKGPRNNQAGLAKVASPCLTKVTLRVECLGDLGALPP